MKTSFFFILFIGLFLISCKNEPNAKSAVPDSGVATPGATSSSQDISNFEQLDHEFNVTPEGSRLFFKGFFKNTLIDAAMTVNKGTLHIKDGTITSGNLNLDMRTAEMVTKRDASIENYLRSKEVFDAANFQNGSIQIDECIKALNDQQATHIIKGKLVIHGKTVPLDVRVRIDYKPKYISILSDQIIVKGSDLGIKMADSSQDNIYFSLTLNGELF